MGDNKLEYRKFSEILKINKNIREREENCVCTMRGVE